MRNKPLFIEFDTEMNDVHIIIFWIEFPKHVYLAHKNTIV